MKFFKPKFWKNKNSIISFLLRPLSLLVEVFIFFNKKFTTQKQFNISVVCIGNIYLGGTGKTPVSIYIASELKKRLKKPVIIKKFYQNQFDEHGLIKETKINLILNKDRALALKDAIKKKFDVAILDDGFQDRSIAKNLNIICFNNRQKIGNGLVIPAGPLRENLESLKKAQIIIINGNRDQEFENKILKTSNNVKIYYSKYMPSNIDQFKNKKLFAFAGIGNPDNFFELLNDCNLDLKK